MAPIWAGLHKPPGSIGGRQPGYTAMRAHMVVVLRQFLSTERAWLSDANSISLRHSSCRRPLKLST